MTTITLNINHIDFINQLEKTFNFTSYEKARKHWSGVLFEIKDNALRRLVATDGNKLAICALQGNNDDIVAYFNQPADAAPFQDAPSNPDYRLIIDNETIANILKYFTIDKSITETSEITVTINTKLFDEAVTVTNGRQTITGNVIDGNFPDYLRVIPQNYQDFSNAIIAPELFISMFKKCKNWKLKEAYKLHLSNFLVLTNECNTNIFVMYPRNRF